MATLTSKGYVKQTSGENPGTWGTGGINNTFDLINANVSGHLDLSGLTNANITLTSDQASNLSYTLSGTLTGNITISWPANVGGFFFVRNETTGAFSITLKNSGGTDVVLAPQGFNIGVYSDGVNMRTGTTSAPLDFNIPGTLTAGEVDSETPYQLGGVPMILGHGLCQFRYSSASVCLLMPYGGNTLAFPDGTVRQVPSGGIQLSNGGLSNATVYNVYCPPTGDLEASITAHTTDAASGIEIKTGDATRVLVGKVYLVGGSFLDSNSSRLVISWFNRQQKTIFNSFTADRTTTSTTPVEINSEIRISLLTWGAAITASCWGTYALPGSGGGDDMRSAIALDALASTFAVAEGGRANDFFTMMNCAGTLSPSEGFHYITIYGARTQGDDTATWRSGTSISGQLMI